MSVPSGAIEFPFKLPPLFIDPAAIRRLLFPPRVADPPPVVVAHVEQKVDETVKTKEKAKTVKDKVSARYIALYQSLAEESIHQTPLLRTDIAPDEALLRAHLKSGDKALQREVQRRLHVWLANERASNALRVPPSVQRHLSNPLLDLSTFTAADVRRYLRPLFPVYHQVNPLQWSWLPTATALHFFKLAATDEKFLCLPLIRGLFSILRYRCEVSADEYHLLIRVFLRMGHLQDAILALHHTKLFNIKWNNALHLDHWKVGQKLGLNKDKGPRRRLKTS